MVVNTTTPVPYLTEFTIFPQLPAELRLKIWRNLFPDAGIMKIRMTPDYDVQDRIVGGCSFCSFISGYCFLCLEGTCECTHCLFEQNNANRPSIITLQINRESRAETLLHFEELFPGLTMYPLYFNPKVDTIEFHDFYRDPVSFAFMFAAIGRLASRYPCNLNTIQSLRVSQMNWSPEIADYFSARFDNVAPHPQADIDVDLKKGGLYSFHGLKSLVLLGEYHPDFSDSHIHFESQAEELKKAVTKCFEREKLRYPECSIPDISISYFSAQEAHGDNGSDNEDDYGYSDCSDDLDNEAPSIASWDSQYMNSDDSELGSSSEEYEGSSAEDEENHTEYEASYDAELDGDHDSEGEDSNSQTQSSSSSSSDDSSSDGKESDDEERYASTNLEGDETTSLGEISDEGESDEDVYWESDW